MLNYSSLNDWYFESHYNGQRRVRSKNLSASLTIENYELDDSRFVKNFVLSPYTLYQAKVHVTCRDVEVQQGEGHTYIGANLSIMDSFNHSVEHEKGVGTFDGDLTLKFFTNKTGQVRLALRLGFYCSEAKGSAVFSSFSIEEDFSRILLGDGIIRLNVESDEIDELPDILDHFPLFLERMTKAYEAMAELYGGKKPFNGDVVVYETRRDIQAWAFAGNPIVWNHRCFLDYFREITSQAEKASQISNNNKNLNDNNESNNNNNSNIYVNDLNNNSSEKDKEHFTSVSQMPAPAPTPMPQQQQQPQQQLDKKNNEEPLNVINACFGCIHEMGHNFDMSGFGRINCELFANLNLCYAVEQNKFPILFDNEMTIGRGLQDGFYRRCYERSIKGKIEQADQQQIQREYHHDGLLYCILRVKDAIGWSPFKAVFGRYAKNENNPTKNKNPTQLLDLLMTELSKTVNFDVRSIFPKGEYEFLMKQNKL